MRIVFVNSNDSNGGAAIAARRICKLLIQSNFEVFLVVQKKTNSSKFILGPINYFQKFRVFLNIFIDKFFLYFYSQKRKIPFHVNIIDNYSLVKRINDLNPDIVHLHWINNGMLSIRDLSKINAPIVWTMHDDWIITGGCNIKYDCEKFTSFCNKCIALNSNNKYDLSYFNFFYKNYFFAKIKNISFVSPSKWLAESAKLSHLLRNHKIVTIPNPIDTNRFLPIDKTDARSFLGLPKEGNIVLFGACDATSDPNKGFKLLFDAISQLDTNNLHFVIFGGEESEMKLYNAQLHFMGYLNDEYSLNLLYNSADVMVVPSLQENLPQTAIEALSCGTPVVAFNTTGLAEIIDHLKCGYLAKFKDSSDLAYGIDWVLNLSNSDKILISRNCRSKVLSSYSNKIAFDLYSSLYNSIIKS